MQWVYQHGMFDNRFAYPVPYSLDSSLGADMQRLYEYAWSHADNVEPHYDMAHITAAGQIVPTIGMLGRREGSDDYRYLYTMKVLLERTAGGREDAVQQARKLLAQIDETVPLGYPSDSAMFNGAWVKMVVEQYNYVPQLPYAQYNDVRGRIASAIIALSQ
jgi:hypothetical protein